MKQYSIVGVVVDDKIQTTITGLVDDVAVKKTVMLSVEEFNSLQQEKKRGEYDNIEKILLKKDDVVEGLKEQQVKLEEERVKEESWFDSDKIQKILRSIQFNDNDWYYISENQTFVAYWEQKKVTIPKLLLRQIVKTFEKKQSVGKYLLFWVKLKQNPTIETVLGFFEFLYKSEMIITDDGDCLMFRNVDLLSDLNNNKDVVLNLFDRLKQTEDDSVRQDILNQIDVLSKNVVYTHWYQKTPRLHYILNKEIRISEEECERDNRISCTKGLHVGNPKWVNNNFGKYSCIVKVSPADVRAVLDDSNVCRVVAFTLIGFVKDWELLKTDNFYDFSKYLSDKHIARNHVEIYEEVVSCDDDEEEEIQWSDEDYDVKDDISIIKDEILSFKEVASTFLQKIEEKQVELQSKLDLIDINFEKIKSVKLSRYDD